MNKINFVPFDINFPINIFSDKQINFSNKNTRNRLFNRSIYNQKNKGDASGLFNERWELLLSLASKIKSDIVSSYNTRVLSVSAFGSSIYSKNNNDYDFLVIINGNKFDMIEKYVSVGEGKYKVGISIKGIDNFTKGLSDKKSAVPIRLQSQIIYRTVISLPKRHIPIIGYDFNYNKKLFLKNCYAQVSDLLCNCYDLYYLNAKNLNKKRRSEKILSRIYEASLYLGEVDFSERIKKIKRNIYMKKISGAQLSESKKTFEELKVIFDISLLNSKKSSRGKNPLSILSNNKAKESILLRLEEYWRFGDLPFKWIKNIIDILSKYNYNEDLAVSKVRRKYPDIVDPGSKKYSQKLYKFRKKKVDALSDYMFKKMSGGIVMDFGGRSDDFSKSLLRKNKKINNIYVTDVGSYIENSKNKSIHFIVQPSLSGIPLPDKFVSAIIISMVLHHIPEVNYKSLFSEFNRVLKRGGKIIIIEDSYKNQYDNRLLKNEDYLFKFMNLDNNTKSDILYFYDWFGNRLMRNRDTIPIIQNFRSLGEWEKVFVNNGFKCIESEFVITPEKYLFPPKSILIFKKL